MKSQGTQFVKKQTKLILKKERKKQQQKNKQTLQPFYRKRNVYGRRQGSGYMLRQQYREQNHDSKQNVIFIYLSMVFHGI